MTCAHCKQPFHRGPQAMRRNQRFCGSVCASAARRIVSIKTCAHCGEQYQRRNHVSAAQWSKSRYCRAECSQRAHKAKRIAAVTIKRTDPVASSDPLLMFLELPILPRQQLSHRDIGVLLGVSHSTVLRIEQAALAKLKRLMERECA